MRFSSPILAVYLLCVSTIIGGEPKAGAKAPQWSGLAISIQKPNTDLTSYDGTQVTALLHIPEHFVVAMDLAKTNFKIVDDKNSDLTGMKRDERVKNIQFSGDGKYVSMTFCTDAFPAKTATKIRVQGNMLVVTGKTEKTIELEDVSLKKNLELEIGKITPGENNALRYLGTRPLKSIKVFDAKISYQLSDLGPRFEEKRGFSAHFAGSTGFKKNVPDRSKVRITYFDDMEKIVVPIDLEVGVGF